MKNKVLEAQLKEYAKKNILPIGVGFVIGLIFIKLLPILLIGLGIFIFIKKVVFRNKKVEAKKNGN